MKSIDTVGVIGFGVMGAAIALNAASAGETVRFKELNDDLVKSMYDKWVTQPLAKKVEKKKMSEAEARLIAGRIEGTSRYEDLDDCDLIIEAAVENFELKRRIFKDLSDVCRDDTIIVSNTSTFPIGQLMKDISHPERTAGLHYFFPANINRLVEVIRQKETSDATFDALTAFSKKNGKIPISVNDFPGFAINPVFIASYMVLNSFYGDTYNAATLDYISRLALGIRYGIMWVSNGSGLGTCYHAAVSMNEYLSNSDVGYPPVPEPLKIQFESGKPWDIEDGPLVEDAAVLNVVKDQLLGTVFTISTHLIEKGVVSVKDLELGICTSLAWPKGPFTMMNDLGMDEAARLVKLAVEKRLFKMPDSFARGVPAAWRI
ncbi:3-hydroxyacyl-CoA dehydrogenase family protein [Desulfococcus multivorans]|uniref:3-hydroxyacyl-CoA dehydrogenase NAD-binding protein n=1 Tax=Desulfococcus multivorans DSM 2059 TaxID=1121405 RepID=S7T6Q4_DESML|nr:3-hydroxyacyl-CoA dehydrogenase family protein [Desulfococcus multivorans]AOY59238.1 Hbd4: 3-hydroxybutyryl-CoA dehydrogenase [Desulfococcus multivorans]AQV01461.1 hypothetical protein B2D07_12320 [Desulfococcus multivorans]EPR32742.1 3-hydroxyacyl-CoA dehydrogenase NAD-binding protein [Desulfococcus multivorans DSM 2059]SKA26482.1 3-hydroxyacyl-CoA dehydrogenase [Desulfococcus multivorans DSM 2059]